MAVTAQRVLYEGRVQGVGFRYTVRQVATGYEISGWVRNLQDGAVELHAQGEPDELATFLQAIPRTHLGALIASSRISDAIPDGDAKGFVIKL